MRIFNPIRFYIEKEERKSTTLLALSSSSAFFKNLLAAYKMEYSVLFLD
jgi:hypothetical protein